MNYEILSPQISDQELLQSREKIPSGIPRLLGALAVGTETAAVGDELGAKIIGVGAFYETHSIVDAEEAKTGKVLKVLRLGFAFSEKGAAKMFAGHRIEEDRMRHYFGDMVAKSTYLIDSRYKNTAEEVIEGHLPADERSGRLYNWKQFIGIQIDRRLQSGYQKRDFRVSDDEKSKTDKALLKIGSFLEKRGLKRRNPIGVILSEEIQGITFDQFFEDYKGDDEARKKVKGGVLEFVARTREFNKKFSLLWHDFKSDNIVLETDDEGKLTGNVRILDTNFTEKSAKIMEKGLSAAMDKRMLVPLENYFGDTESAA